MISQLFAAAIWLLGLSSGHAPTLYKSEMSHPVCNAHEQALTLSKPHHLTPALTAFSTSLLCTQHSSCPAATLSHPAPKITRYTPPPTPERTPAPANPITGSLRVLSQCFSIFNTTRAKECAFACDQLGNCECMK